MFEFFFSRLDSFVDCGFSTDKKKRCHLPSEIKVKKSEFARYFRKFTVPYQIE